MWNLLFLAYQWHKGNRSFVLLSLALFTVSPNFDNHD